MSATTEPLTLPAERLAKAREEYEAARTRYADVCASLERQRAAAGWTANDPVSKRLDEQKERSFDALLSAEFRLQDLEELA